MPELIQKTTKQIRRRRKTRSFKFKRNGERGLSLENLIFPSHEKVMKKIRKKVGKRPSKPSDLPGGDWSPQALKVLLERYLVRDEKGKVIETPEEMCWRVSWEIASAEGFWGKNRRQVMDLAKQFYKLLVSRQFLPNSPTLMNAGTGNNLQFSACFVLPIEDSMEGIFDALKYQALIHKSGGGTGFAFSRLRPKGSVVKSSSGTASGPISFMRIFDAATSEVKQGGKRRGANMGILQVDHPDIMEFIQCKREGGITNFNISIGITDKYMRAYEKDEDYNLVDPKTRKKVGRLSARKVFDEITQGAWETGDPGLVFLDRKNKGTSNPVPSLGPIEATNPCGEQPLYPFDACNLGSIFLTYFVKDKDGKQSVDWERLKNVTRLAVRFLDNVIEVNPYPLDQIRQTVLAIRRIGLGVGGWADMLVELGIPYDSEKALKLAGKVMKVIQEEALKTTQELADERGPFPLWPVSIYKEGVPRRNSTVTTIAPTGTISIIAGASSGIEPLFAIAFQHIVHDKHLNRALVFVNPRFEKMAKEHGFWSEELKEKVGEHGVVGEIEEIPRDIKRLFATAHEIHHDWHIKMQSVFQKYTENSVSKTINLRNGVTAEDIRETYLLAWRTNCKGITVFRDGCKDAQVLNLGLKGRQLDETTQVRSFKAVGATYKLKSPVGTAFITINENENGEPLEVFINVGKAGTDVAAMAEALGRTISTALRFRGQLRPREKAEEIAHQLSGIGGRRSVGFGPNKIRSLPDAIALALSSHFGFKINNNGGNMIAEKNSNREAGAVMVAKASAQETAQDTPPQGGVNDPTPASASLETVSGDICPSCGATSLVYEEGCSKCYICGHSEC